MTDTSHMRVMVALEAGPPSVFELERRALPQPGEGEVRLKVAYCCLNPFDVSMRKGKARMPWLTWPAVLGFEHSGLVDTVGDGVDLSWLGRRVISRAGRGGYAEYAVAPVDALIPVPEALNWQQATAYRACTMTAWHALHTAGRLEAGERVLVHSAAGAVGTMATQIAKEADATVYGLAGGERKIEFARPFGADRLLDYLTPDWVDHVQELTGGAGVDLIIDGNQGPDAELNYGVLAKLGRVIYIGSTAGEPAPPIPVGTLLAKSILVGGLRLRAVDTPDSEAERDAIDAIASGRWRLPITDIVEMEDIPTMHERFENRALMGRVLIRIGGELT